MKIKIVLLVFLFAGNVAFSQVTQTNGIFLAKEFSKEIAMYKAKQYVMSNILEGGSTAVEFQIDPLAAASSGELTSLVYKSENQNRSGMVLGFYGSRWNEAGVIYQAYAFKDLNEEKAIEILNILEETIDKNTKFLNSDRDVNNIFFEYDDMTFLIYISGSIKIRVFWNDFDAEWESTAFNRTKRRFEKKIK